ncbi:MAG: pantoate--beta-alanine ligase [Phycisphaerales bacterium]|nr:pantoate--beta-alanine ligase [Phycisphaerales bacterium]
MKTLLTIHDFRAWRKSIHTHSPITFVPTMGALHEGHASLVRHARELAGPAGHVIASIFVNPTQFGPNEDYNQYPRTLESDLRILTAAQCDAVFVPSAHEMYPHPPTTPTLSISIDPGPLADMLEGAPGSGRPGHFRGVCTVVAKLLNITQPTHLFLGQKDFQQQTILRRMCKDLDMPVEVVTCPTIRESDGLALSSRNRYLDPDERPRALGLYEALTWAKTEYANGRPHLSPAELECGMKTRLEARGLAVQYAVIAHSETLVPWTNAIAPSLPPSAVALVAAKLGATRLIDNMLL